MLTTLLIFCALEPGLALAQEPVTVTGEVNDGGVTRTITLTLIFTPVLIADYQPIYTTTLTTGSDFVIGRSASYGQVLAGAAGLMTFLAFVFAIAAGVINGRNV